MTAGLKVPARKIEFGSFEGDSQALALIHLIEQLRRENYRFTTVTPFTHAQINQREENSMANDSRGIFGWSRPFSKTAVSAEIVELMEQAGVLKTDGSLWRSRVRVSSLGAQLIAHSAYPTTAPDSIFFGPDTYRFVAAIEQHLRNRPAVIRAIDVGCGAGPGAIVIAAAHPAAEVLAIDINDSALRMTAINAAAAGLPGVIPVHSNLLVDVDGEFDLIVSNPPYLVDAGARTYRHGGGHLGEGLSIDIVEAALPRLAQGGSLLLYTGVAIVDGIDPFHAAVEPSLEKSGFRWSYHEIDPDIFAEELSTPPYRHAERIAAVCLTVTRC